MVYFLSKVYRVLGMMLIIGGIEMILIWFFVLVYTIVEKIIGV